MHDLNFLQLFFTRATYEQYKDYINPDLFNAEVKRLYKSLDTFYKQHGKEVTTTEEFRQWFLLHDKRLTNEDYQIYNNMFAELPQEQDSTTVLAELKRTDIFHKISQVLKRNGSIEEVQQILETSDKDFKNCLEPAVTDFEKVYEDDVMNPGLSWRLDSLNTHLHRFSLGAFILVVAAVGAGKSSFMASEVAHIVKQLKDDEVICWFFSEGTQLEMQARYWSALFTDHFKKRIPYWLIKEWVRDGKAAELNELYLKIVGGRERVFVFNTGYSNSSLIQNTVKRYNTKLIILDLLDDVKVTMSNKNFNLVDQKEAVSKWARDLAVNVAPVLATTHLPAMAEHWDERQRYPLMEDIAGSKVGVQKRAKGIITLGCSTDEVDQPYRYLGITKEKSGEKGSKGVAFKAVLNFDFDTSIFTEIKQEGEL